MDRFTKKKRSEIMSKIRSKRTRPEIFFHNLLKGNKIRHKLWPKMLGNPDAIVFPRTLVFVNGCFWHGCPRHFRAPKTNRKFWLGKIRNNIKRQKKVLRILRSLKYEAIVIWEHDLR